MQHSESVAKIAAALVAVAGEIENPTKNATNPHFKNRYADLAEIAGTSRPVLTKHGLAVIQSPGMEDGLATLDTLILHTSGEWIQGRAAAPLSKADPQGVGSAITYLRRYSLAAMLGLAQEDDDGEGAVDRPRSQAGNGHTPRQPWERPMPFGSTKGTKLGDLDPKQLSGALDWCNAEPERAQKFADLVKDLEATIARNVGTGEALWTA